MIFLNIYCIVLSILFILNDWAYSIISPKYFITYFAKIRLLIIINTNKNNTLIRK